MSSQPIEKWNLKEPTEEEFETNLKTKAAYDNMKDMMRNRNRGLFETLWYFFSITIPSKLLYFWFEIKNIFSYMRTGHSIGEYWSIDYHILEDLKYNLPILIENHVGYPSFIAENARKQLGIVDNKINEQNDKESELALKMWEDDLKFLLENVLLYEYYESFGIVSNDDKQMVEIDKKYRHTLPYKEGTNKELDYAKLYELSQSNWNNIWDWMKEKGQALWD